MTAEAASPDTPTDPREVADKVAIEAARVYSRSIQRDLWAPMMFATSVAKQVVAALADAGLLSLSGDSTREGSGSLRSEASGTPAETVAEALRGYRLNLGPNAVDSIKRGMTRLDLTGGERRDIGLIAAKALGLEEVPRP